MTDAQNVTLTTARKAVTSAVDAFVTDATPGTGLPALVAALHKTRLSIDPTFPMLGGATQAEGALLVAIGQYLQSKIIAGTYTGPAFPWP